MQKRYQKRNLPLVIEMPRDELRENLLRGLCKNTNEERDRQNEKLKSPLTHFLGEGKTE